VYLVLAPVTVSASGAARAQMGLGRGAPAPTRAGGPCAAHVLPHQCGCAMHSRAEPPRRTAAAAAGRRLGVRAAGGAGRRRRWGRGLGSDALAGPHAAPGAARRRVLLLLLLLPLLLPCCHAPRRVGCVTRFTLLAPAPARSPGCARGPKSAASAWWLGGEGGPQGGLGAHGRHAPSPCRPGSTPLRPPLLLTRPYTGRRRRPCPCCCCAELAAAAARPAGAGGSGLRRDGSGGRGFPLLRLLL